MNTSKGKFWDEGIQLIDGCTPCSPGCEHCWSAAITARFDQSFLPLTDINKKFYGKIVCHPERLSRFNKKKPTVFAIWNDFWHEDVGDGLRFIAYDIMEKTPWHTYLILTKRPQNIHIKGKLDNVYHGLTVCTQAEADEKIPIFLQVPGKKFLCLEPLLENIDFYDQTNLSEQGLGCLILGCETGAHRRPMRLEWAENIIEQCDTMDVPVFVKAIEINGKVEKDISKWPEKFRRRELPWG